MISPSEDSQTRAEGSRSMIRSIPSFLFQMRRVHVALHERSHRKGGGTDEQQSREQGDTPRRTACPHASRSDQQTPCHPEPWRRSHGCRSRAMRRRRGSRARRSRGQLPWLHFSSGAHAQLTDDDLMYAKGKDDGLLGRLQTRLGESQDQIRKPIAVLKDDAAVRAAPRWWRAIRDSTLRHPRAPGTDAGSSR